MFKIIWQLFSVGLTLLFFYYQDNIAARAPASTGGGDFSAKRIRVADHAGLATAAETPKHPDVWLMPILHLMFADINLQPLEQAKGATKPLGASS